MCVIKQPSLPVALCVQAPDVVDLQVRSVFPRIRFGDAGSRVQLPRGADDVVDEELEHDDTNVILVIQVFQSRSNVVAARRKSKPIFYSRPIARPTGQVL